MLSCVYSPDRVPWWWDFQLTLEKTDSFSAQLWCLREQLLLAKKKGKAAGRTRVSSSGQFSWEKWAGENRKHAALYMQKTNFRGFR